MILISIALVGTAVFVAVKKESGMRTVKVRVKKNYRE